MGCGCMPGKSHPIPKKIKLMEKSNKKVEIQIQYSQETGGTQQANYLEKLIKTVYENSRVYTYGYEQPKNVIVKVQGKQAYQKKVDGEITPNNAQAIFNKIRDVIQKQGK